MKNKIIGFSASLFVLLIFIYISTIAVSLHRFHKAIFNNDQILIKETVDFAELKKSIKENFNSIMLDSMKNEKDSSSSINILAAGIASKFSEMIIDSYATPTGLSLLINEMDIKKLPKPNILMSYGFVADIEFVNLGHIYFILEKEEKKIPIHFKRNGLSWKLSEIKINELKNLNEEIFNLEKNNSKTKALSTNNNKSESLRSCIKITDVKSRKIVSNSVYSEYAWIVKYRNSCSKSFNGYATFEFLDEEEFILHDGYKAINILGNSEVEAKGNELIQIEKSNRISKTSAGFKTSLF